MSVAPASSTVNNPRKRCELACRPCRHRKIKCQNSMPNQPICDNCRNKGKTLSECKYVPVAEDWPPARPRQSPPAVAHTSYPYPHMAPISPVREHHAPLPHSSPSESTGYYSHAYAPYHGAPQASTSHTHYPPSPPQIQHTSSYGSYGQPASPTHSVAYSEGAPSGMVAPDMEYSWGPGQVQGGYTSPVPVSATVPVVGQEVWPANVPDHLVDPAATYYADQVPGSPVAYASAAQYQPTNQYQYAAYSNTNNGSYYSSP